MTDHDSREPGNKPEVLEAESVEYMPYEAQTPASGLVGGEIPQPHGRVYVYRENRMPCCGGCGCFLVALALLLWLPGLAFFHTILVVLATVVASRFFMNISGVPRWSPTYPILFVPVFVALLSLIQKLVKGQYMFSIPQFLLICGIAMVALFVIRKRSV